MKYSIRWRAVVCGIAVFSARADTLKPTRHLACCIRKSGLLLTFAVCAFQAHAAGIDPKSGWFKPTLTAQEESICPTFLEAAQEGFLSTVAIDSWINEADLKAAGLETVDTANLDTNHVESPASAGATAIRPPATGASNAPFVVVAGTKLYLNFHTNPGCGGACESQGVTVSADPTLAYSYPKNNPNAIESPPAQSWILYRRGRSDYYLVGAVDQHIQVYRVVPTKQWKLTCDIAGAPEDLSKSSNPDLRAAAEEVHALDLAVGGLAGNGGGDCGSMQTGGRWAFEMHKALLQTIYRPWAMQSFDSSIENSYGDYDRNMQNLEYWATAGIYEHQALDAYRLQLSATTVQLTTFYAVQFGWPKAQASAMADQSLKAAIGRAFGFYMFLPSAGGGPDPERPLREAILDHLPMSQITALGSDPLKANSTGVDSNLLSVSVLYPEALRYLLEHGLDPNAANAFGKTALMYAAQYNQLESAAALLDHGADPNAATTWTSDTCNYVLRTSGMTPLHYAVRYASEELIRLLLSRGALSFYKTDTKWGNHDYPFDWLKRYADLSTTGHNPNLSEAEAAKLEDLLRVPAPLELAGIAAEFTRRAETEYAAGQLDKSYRTILGALSAEPGNERALADLSIVALRSGHLGPSLKASSQLIAKATSPTLLASAWFNEGLACNQPAVRVITYDGQFYCLGDIFRPFLQSWELSPSDARASQLQQLFKADKATTCSVSHDDPDRYHFEFTNEPEPGTYQQVQRIYVMHPSGQHIAPASIHWIVQMNNSGKLTSTAVVPHLVKRYDLGGFAITLLESERMAQGPVTIGDQVCHPYN